MIPTLGRGLVPGGRESGWSDNQATAPLLPDRPWQPEKAEAVPAARGRDGFGLDSEIPGRPRPHATGTASVWIRRYRAVPATRGRDGFS